MTDDQIHAAALEAAQAATPQLEAMAESIIEKHGVEKAKLDRADLTRFALAIHDIQFESFHLGVQTGLRLFVSMVEKSQETP